MKPLLGSAYMGCYRNDVDEAALCAPSVGHYWCFGGAVLRFCPYLLGS